MKRKERIHKFLELIELDGHEDKKARELSGGMQRRLSLAAAIMHEPDLLFLDEPTASIDPVLRQKFWDYFQQLREEGRTLFVTTQYVNEAVNCDLVGVMTNGRMLIVDSPHGLRTRVLGGEIIHLFTENLLPEPAFNDLRNQSFVRDGRVTRLQNTGISLLVEDASLALPQVLEWCQNRDIPIESVTEHVPMFDEIFVELLEGEFDAHERDVVVTEEVAD